MARRVIYARYQYAAHPHPIPRLPRKTPPHAAVPCQLHYTRDTKQQRHVLDGVLLQLYENHSFVVRAQIVPP